MMSNRIRLFLLILTFSLIATAITINNTIGDNDILNLDTQTLTENLHAKEDIIDDMFNDTLLLKTFANSERYPLQVKELSDKFKEKYIFLFIFKNKKPIFWSTNIYVPETESGLQSQISYINADHRSMVIKQKKINDEITILSIIPIKRFIKGNADYLNSAILPRLISSKNLDIADFGDSQNIKNIYSKNGTYLFSVKLNEGKHNTVFVAIQLICWILATLSFVLFIQSVCIELAKRGRPWLSIIVISITFFLVRVLDLQTNWLSDNSSMSIFDPEKYSYNYFLPNLWSFIINSIAILWIVCHCLYIKDKLTISEKLRNTPLGVFVFYVLLCFLYLTYNLSFHHLSTFITHSSILDYDFMQILKSHPFSLYFIFIYCVNILSLILLTDFILSLGKDLCIKATFNINTQLIVLVQFLIIAATNNDFTLVNVFIALIILIRSFDQSMFKENKISTHVISLVALSIISAIVFSDANRHAQENLLKDTLATLKSEDDQEAIVQFDLIEKDILNDNHILKTLEYSLPSTDSRLLNTYFKRKYLNGYLSKYDFQGFYYLNGEPLDKYRTNKINEYREKVINSTKINSKSNFYRYTTDIGTFEYFAVFQLHISEGNELTVILNFMNRSFNQSLPFPTILYSAADEEYFQKNLNENSFAFYKNGTLITQNGKYIYPSNDESYPKDINQYINYDDGHDFFHVVFNPNNFTSIVVSKQKQTYWQFIALASLSFLLLYVVTAIIQIILVLIPIFSAKRLSIQTISYRISRLTSEIRYSTRIQTLVIASVLLAIIFSGIVTFISIINQSENNRQDEKLEYISKIVNRIESNISHTNNEEAIVDIERLIKDISTVMISNFNLYSNTGKLIYSTQPKIYDQKIISQFMNSDALLNLNVLKKSEIIHKESVSDFKYDVTYATIRNANYQTLAYLSIPYFNSYDEDVASQNTLLNTILNIYTVIIILFAFLSVFISNKITEPLQFIGRKLADTSLSGKPNEPLYWDKNDEIGSLIKEYNYMLIKLEENALQLRNKERETAWREMAQQVAHEIKNPLTPMKLGIQQLNRSFNENDPNLEERFKKISTSFIDQIDALSHIASEFSSFAKLPETKMTVINLMEKITKSTDTYNNNPNTDITVTNNTKLQNIKVLGDRDQMLRTFNNLIKNAIEAGKNRRKLKIDILIAKKGDNRVEIQIKDNGMGIPEDVIPNIFRPNFTTKSSGTGLGLAFVKQTIDGMNGRIRFETNINIGTTFFIDLPLYEDKDIIS